MAVRAATLFSVRSRTVLAALVDLVLPGTCAGCGATGPAVCPECFSALSRPAVCSPPDPCPAGLPAPWAVAAYDGVVRAVVVAHKEHTVLALARPLGAALARAVAAAAPTGPLALVPVPSSPRAIRARGHDPMWRITEHAVSALRGEGRDVRAVRALRVVRRVSDQSGLTAAQRQVNVAGAFDANPRGHARLARIVRHGARAVVVDDIVTSGATTTEAVRALGARGIAVAGVAVVAATRRRGNLPRPGNEG